MSQPVLTLDTVFAGNFVDAFDGVSMPTPAGPGHTTRSRWAADLALVGASPPGDAPPYAWELTLRQMLWLANHDGYFGGTFGLVAYLEALGWRTAAIAEAMNTWRLDEGGRPPPNTPAAVVHAALAAETAARVNGSAYTDDGARDAEILADWQADLAAAGASAVTVSASQRGSVGVVWTLPLAGVFWLAYYHRYFGGPEADAVGVYLAEATIGAPDTRRDGVSLDIEGAVFDEEHAWFLARRLAALYRRWRDGQPDLTEPRSPALARLIRVAHELRLPPVAADPARPGAPVATFAYAAGPVRVDLDSVSNEASDDAHDGVLTFYGHPDVLEEVFRLVASFLSATPPKAVRVEDPA